MSDAPSSKSVLLSLAIFALAGAIAYLAFSLTQVAGQIPALLTQVERTSQNIQPVTEQIPDVLNTINKVSDHIPNALEEAKGYRELIPQVLNEAEQVRNTLPEVFKRVDALDAQVTKINQQLPNILETANKAVVAVNETNQTAEKVIPLVPEVLEQVTETRKEIPGYIDRIEQVVVNAREISEEAGIGAVKGVFKGIVSTPFDLLQGAEKKLTGAFKGRDKITEKDNQRIAEAAKVVMLSSGNVVDSSAAQPWSNPESGNSGEVKVVKRFNKGDEYCLRLDVSILYKGKSEEHIQKDICQNAEGHWYMLSDLDTSHSSGFFNLSRHGF